MKFSSLSYMEKKEHNSDSRTTENIDMVKLKFSPFVLRFNSHTICLRGITMKYLPCTVINSCWKKLYKGSQNAISTSPAMLAF